MIVSKISHPIEGKVDPWQILQSFERSHVKIEDRLILSYLSAFRTEIIELAAQVAGDYELAGYKINPQANLARVFLSGLKRTLRALFENPVSTNTPARTEIPELLFFIEYKNHLKHFEPVGALMIREGIPFQTIFLRKDLFEANAGTTPNAVFIRDFNLKKDCLKSNLQLLRTDLWILANGFLNSVQKKNSLRLRLELLSLNGRLLKDTYLLEHALHRVLADGKKRVAVFFKSEGHRVRSLIAVCKKHGVETIAIQHGYMGVELKYSGLPIDHYLAWSDMFCANLKHSLSNCHCVPMGSPGFDKLFRQRNESLARPLNQNSVNLLFLPNSGNSQTPRSEVVFALDLCLWLAGQYPNIKLTVKPHPGDSSGTIRERIKKQGGSVCLLDRFAPISFDEFDIVATMNSTSGIEAAIFSKPLLVILSNPDLLMIPEYLDYKIGLHADSEESIRLAFHEIIENYFFFQENCKRFVEAHLCNPGLAAESASKYILNRLHLPAENMASNIKNCLKTINL